MYIICPSNLSYKSISRFVNIQTMNDMLFATK